MILKVFLCNIIPVLLLCGMLEKRSRHVILALCNGCLACLAACYLNTWVHARLGCDDFYLTTSVAPCIEEIFKFIPIFVFSRRVSREKRLLLSVAFAVGMGFATVENAFMLAQSLSSATIPWLFVRGIGTGLMHGMSTTLVGIGIYLACKDRRMLFTGTLATLFLAMLYHGAYNAMVQTETIRYFGIFVPLLSYAAVLVLLNKEKIREYLNQTEETDHE